MYLYSVRGGQRSKGAYFDYQDFIITEGLFVAMVVLSMELHQL